MKITEAIVSILLALYGLSVMIMATYFNFLYANENGFLAWLFFGEIIATLKGIVWPYFIFIAG